MVKVVITLKNKKYARYLAGHVQKEHRTTKGKVKLLGFKK